MHNAVFGKTMENVREHVNFELVNDIKRYETCVSSPTFKHQHYIHDRRVGIEKTKSIVKLNKPIFAGFAILDLSKLHMYKFFYDVLKPKYGDNVELGYTDTDSFVIYVKTDDIYEDLKELNEYMDFSEYPKDHPNYDASNKKVIGKIKDELKGNRIEEFIGLKPKMYSYRVDAAESNKTKGIPKKTLKRALNFENDRRTLE